MGPDMTLKPCFLEIGFPRVFYQFKYRLKLIPKILRQLAVAIYHHLNLKKVTVITETGVTRILLRATPHEHKADQGGPIPEY